MPVRVLLLCAFGLASAQGQSPVPTGSMNLPRYGHTATLLNNGMVLVTGGVIDHGTFTETATAELYNPQTGTWRYTGIVQQTTMTQAREAHTATRLADGRVLIVGGFGSGRLASAEIFDPLTETLTPSGSMTNGRSSHAAVLLNDGRVLVVGGYESNAAGPEAEIYDPAAQTWTPSSVGYHGPDVALARLLNGKVLATGGTYTSRVDLFDPVSNTWQQMTALPFTRRTHSASTLPNGTVLVAGGNDGSTATYTAEIYDVNANNGTGGSTPVPGTLTVGGWLHSAVSLPNGDVLLAGGQTSPPPAPHNSNSTANAQLYSFQTNTFSSQPPMLVPRMVFPITLLQNGQILTCGGADFEDNVGATATVLKQCEVRAGVASVLLESRDNQVLQFDGTTGSPLGTFASGQFHPEQIAFGPDGNLYIPDDNAGAVFRFNGVTGAFMGTFVPAGSGGLLAPRGLAFGPDGNLYLADAGRPFGSGTAIRRYSSLTGAPIGTGVFASSADLNVADAIYFGPDGNLYVANDGGNSILRFNGTTGAPLPAPGNTSAFFVSPGSAGLVRPSHCAFLPDGSLLVSSPMASQIFRYDGTTGAFMNIFATLGAVDDILFGPDGKLYATAAPGSTYRFNGTTFDPFIPSFSGNMVFKSGSPALTGTINVITNLSAATFNITGPANYSGGGTSFTQTNTPSGTYTITYGAVVGSMTPPSQHLTLSAGGSINFIALYLSTALTGTPGTTTNQSPYIAEPVNTATGNYYTSHTDLLVPGKGLSFAFTRYYNSVDSYTGPLGAGWTHSYNISLRQVSGNVVIKEGDGHEDVFNPTGSGNYTAQTPGLFDLLRMNGDGSFTATRKNQTQLNFSSGGKLLAIVDRNGNNQTLTYSVNNLVSVMDSSGRVFTFSYDGNNRLASLIDPLGRMIQYAYDGGGNLISFRDALGGLTQYTYDASHRMTSAIDPRGNTYLQNSYDAQGRVVVQKNARGASTTFAYDTPVAGTTTITDPLGNSTKQVHDANLRWTQTIDSLGGVVSYAYNGINLKASVTDQLGRAQSFAYDSNGNLTGATDSNGNATQSLYDAQNNLLQITDRLGRVTKFTYDSKGNLLSSLGAAGNASSFTYDSAGEVMTAKSARNFATGFTYDAAGNLTRITDAIGGSVQMTYDGVGRLLTAKNQLGNTSSRSYDANNRLLSVADPLGNTTRFAYDSNGNLVQLTDADNIITRYTYDSTNKLSQVTDAIGGVTSYSYDGNTDLLSVTNTKAYTTTYSYDTLRRLRSTTDPLGKQKIYGYDAVGNVTSTVDGNGKTNVFSYDSLNRLISMALSDAKSVSYTYDAVGNRLTMTDWRGTTQYVSDSLNRVTSVATPDGRAVRYGYDAVGNRVRLTYPGGHAVQYAYDALNRLAQATDWDSHVTTYGYDAAGNLTSMNQPNRTSSTYGYDAANRLLQVSNFTRNDVDSRSLPARLLSSFTYGLDNVGNRLQITSSTGVVTRYGYDQLYRLTSWTTPTGQTTQYAYDPVGNRTSVTSATSTTNYTYDAADQLLAAGLTTFGYDGNGSLIRKTTGSTTTTYAWDALNRLIAVTGNDVGTRYAYDGDGNRVQQQIRTGTYQYVNDSVTPLPVVLREGGPDGSIEYVQGKTLISESTSSGQYYYQVDGLGSTVNVTDQNGALQANYGYDPWGQVSLPVDPPGALDELGTKNKFKFTGAAVDLNDTFVFLRARYYDPAIGRFISRDRMPGAMFLPRSQNAYQYAVNNPVRITDPSGLTAVDEFTSVANSWDIHLSPQTLLKTILFTVIFVETIASIPQILANISAPTPIEPDKTDWASAIYNIGVGIPLRIYTFVLGGITGVFYESAFPFLFVIPDNILYFPYYGGGNHAQI